MTRPAAAWIPDGRAKAIRADCEASLAALDGLPIDLYLVHAPDPRTPWRTSVRALARLVDEGLVRRVGARERQPAPARRGARARARHRRPGRAQPLRRPRAPRRSRRALRRGGHRRDRPLAARRAAPRGRPRPTARRSPTSRDAHGATPAEVALAWLLDLVAGRRRDPGRAAARDRALRRPRRDARARRRTSAQRSTARSAGPPAGRVAATGATTRDVVLVMGIPGAGKSRVAEELRRPRVPPPQPRRARRLPARARRRARRGAVGGRPAGRARQHVPHARGAELRDRGGEPPRHRGAVHLARHAARPGAGQPRRAAARAVRLAARPPEELREAGAARARACSRRRPRCARSASSSRRRPTRGSRRRAGAVRARAGRRAGAAGRLRRGRRAEAPGWSTRSTHASRDAPHLVFDWSPDGVPDALAADVARLSAEVSGPVEAALCPHAAGPPICWCRPPLPGLPLAFARAHGVDPSRSILVGTGPAHRTLATTLGARYVPV